MHFFYITGIVHWCHAYRQGHTQALQRQLMDLWMRFWRQPALLLCLWVRNWTHISSCLEKSSALCCFAVHCKQSVQCVKSQEKVMMVPFCLVTIMYILSDHMTFEWQDERAFCIMSPKSHGHRPQASQKGRVCPCSDEPRMTAFRLHLQSLVCFQARSRDAHDLHTCCWLYEFLEAWRGFRLQRASVCLCISVCLCSVAWNKDTYPAVMRRGWMHVWMVLSECVSETFKDGVKSTLL